MALKRTDGFEEYWKNDRADSDPWHSAGSHDVR
jgi:hypothetical protein